MPVLDSTSTARQHHQRMSQSLSWTCAAVVSCLFVVVLVSAECRSNTVLRDVPSSHSRTPRQSRPVVRRSADDEFAVVIDAGSSGSRVRVYRWPVGTRGHAEVTGIVSITPTLKIQPGLSALEDDKPGIREHISQLVLNASRIIPEEHHSKTPIYVMATAGMRLLLEEKMNQVVHFIDLLMRDSTVNPFSYSTSSDTRILSGEEEGVFAWITVNYLYESFTDITGEKPTVGILEMGGASTQIAFAPRGNVLADKFPVTIGRVTYPLYVHSYLDYGQNNVDKWLKGRLLRGNLSGQHISNPCMLKDDLETDPSFNRTFIGTGEPYKCIELLRQHVYKSDASRCQPKPCAIGSFYQPTLPPNMTFFAIGSYIYTLKPIGALAEDGQYIPSVGYDKAVEFCQKPVTEHRSRTPGNQLKFLGSKCMLGLYFALLLNHGYGFPNDTRHIYVRDKIGGQPPDWTLGAVLYESVQPGCAGTRPVYGLASTLRPTGGGAFFTYLSAAVVLCVCQLIIGHQNVKAWIHQHWSL